MRSFGFLLSSILYPGALWYLSVLDPKVAPFPFDSGHTSVRIAYFEFIYPYRVYLGLLLLGGMILFTGIRRFLERRDPKKSLIEKILQQIIAFEFQGDFDKYRITVFQGVGWRKAIGVYFKEVIFFQFRFLIRRRCFWSTVLNMPKPTRRYLTIFSRKGIPGENRRSAIFNVPQSDEEVDSFTSFAWHKSVPQKVTLPDISDINIHEKDALGQIRKPDQKRRLTQYMRLGKMKDFNKLKSIHRFSRHLWATPLLDKDQNQWGIMIFDSDAEVSPFENSSAFTESMRRYSGIIEKVINN